MPFADRLFYTVFVEYSLIQLKGTAFQDFFNRFAIVKWGEDFEPWKPHGSSGDFKCDGRLVSSKRVFQCYAPETYRASEYTKKIREDFEGAVEYWKEDMKKWVFVHNQKKGLPAKALVLMNNLRAEYPDVEIIEWSPDQLVVLSEELSEAAIQNAFNLSSELDPSDSVVRVMENFVRERRASSLLAETEIDDRPNRLQLDEELEQLNETDRELMRRILGYSMWFDPVSKSEVHDRLNKIGFGTSHVEIVAQRLHEAELIQVTEDYYLPVNDVVCQQAAETLMEEILGELRE